MLTFALLACWSPGAQPVELLAFAQGTPSNVLLIGVDTLRRDTVGRYAQTDDTPFMDGLLASGLALDDHAGCSNWTVAAFLCLYTGTRPLDQGFEPDSNDPEVTDIPLALDSLPLAFSRAGFQTVQVNANPWLDAGLDWPPGRAFDIDQTESMVPAERVVEMALEVAGVLDSPWFFQVHTIDPHEPYEAPEAWREPTDPITYDLLDPVEVQRLEADWFTLSETEQETILAWADAEYRAEVRYVDSELARLWTGLEAAGLLEDTLVLLVSDHGQQHMERGRWAHGHHLHQEETSAIAGLWAAGLEPGNWTGMTTHQDLGVTLAALYGLSLPDATGIVVGEATEERARTMFQYRIPENGTEALPRHSAETERYRVSYAWDGVLRIHDKQADPAEEQDVLGTLASAEVDELWALLEADITAAEALLGHIERVEPVR